MPRRDACRSAPAPAALSAAFSRADPTAAGAAGAIATGGAGGGDGGASGRSRNTAMPITPTWSGRPVRAAYDRSMDANSKAATAVSDLRQPLMS